MNLTLLILQSVWPVLLFVGSMLWLGGKHKGEFDSLREELHGVRGELEHLNGLREDLHAMRLNQEKHAGRIAALEQRDRETMQVRTEWQAWRIEADRKLERILTILDTRTRSGQQP